MTVDLVACPCCGYATLETRGEYEICEVCFWEDDGQDNNDADENHGGPNYVSLNEGRQNFLQYGVAELKDRAHVRLPREDDSRLRFFELEGDAVVERTREGALVMRFSRVFIEVDPDCVHVALDKREEGPLSALSEETPHLHGDVRWMIRGQCVPGVGGPESSACFNEWWDALTAAIRRLGSEAEYRLHVGDPGYPDYLFEREGERVFLSIFNPPLFGGGAYPDWQRVVLSWAEFIEVVHSFKQQL